MKANPDIYYLLVNNKIEPYPIKVGNNRIASSKYERLQSIKVDQQLILNEHIQ